jgi:putative endopeptidase
MYCREAPQGWNLGGIGAVVAHEITHAFDMEGRYYNEKAVYKQWWTRKNINRFEKATRKVTKFYGKYKHLGIQVDGKRTLSENWADLGGVRIALNALKVTCASEELLEAYKHFFISYAVSWRTSIRRKKMIFSMMMSVHAQSVDRVDRIVPQFQEWVDTFQIHETDALYLRPADRLKFF